MASSLDNTLLLNPVSVGDNRIKEIRSLYNKVSQFNGRQLTFQALPRHRRRRTMSHNLYRLPASVRDNAVRELKAVENGREKTIKARNIGKNQKLNNEPYSKALIAMPIPVRKVRRNPSTLLNERVKRDAKKQTDVSAGKSLWMPSHIFLAKRMKMGTTLPSIVPIKGEAEKEMESITSYTTTIPMKSSQIGERCVYRMKRDETVFCDRTYLRTIVGTFKELDSIQFFIKNFLPYIQIRLLDSDNTDASICTFSKDLYVLTKTLLESEEFKQGINAYPILLKCEKIDGSKAKDIEQEKSIVISCDIFITKTEIGKKKYSYNVHIICHPNDTEFITRMLEQFKIVDGKEIITQIEIIQEAHLALQGKRSLQAITRIFGHECKSKGSSTAKLWNSIKENPLDGALPSFGMLTITNSIIGITNPVQPELAPTEKDSLNSLINSKTYLMDYPAIIDKNFVHNDEDILNTDKIIPKLNEDNDEEMKEAINNRFEELDKIYKEFMKQEEQLVSEIDFKPDNIEYPTPSDINDQFLTISAVSKIREDTGLSGVLPDDTCDECMSIRIIAIPGYMRMNTNENGKGKFIIEENSDIIYHVIAPLCISKIITKKMNSVSMLVGEKDMRKANIIEGRNGSNTARFITPLELSPYTPYTSLRAYMFMLEEARDALLKIVKFPYNKRVESCRDVVKKALPYLISETDKYVSNKADYSVFEPNYNRLYQISLKEDNRALQSRKCKGKKLISFKKWLLGRVLDTSDFEDTKWEVMSTNTTTTTTTTVPKEISENKNKNIDNITSNNQKKEPGCIKLTEIIDELEHFKFTHIPESPYHNFGVKRIVYKQGHYSKADCVVDKDGKILGVVMFGGYSLSAGRTSGIVFLLPNYVKFSGDVIIKKKDDGKEVFPGTIY